MRRPVASFSDCGVQPKCEPASLRSAKCSSLSKILAQPWSWQSFLQLYRKNVINSAAGRKMSRIWLEYDWILMIWGPLTTTCHLYLLLNVHHKYAYFGVQKWFFLDYGCDCNHCTPLATGLPIRNKYVKLIILIFKSWLCDYVEPIFEINPHFSSLLSSSHIPHGIYKILNIRAWFKVVLIVSLVNIYCRSWPGTLARCAVSGMDKVKCTL